jgi:hypothetical protein
VTFHVPPVSGMATGTRRSSRVVGHISAKPMDII